MTEATVTAKDIDFLGWDLSLDWDKSLTQNLAEMAEDVVSQVWGTLDLEFAIEGSAIGYIRVSSDVEWTFAYFNVGDMVSEAVHHIATNWLPEYRAEHVEETRSHLRALKAQFEAAVRTIDEAISEPDRFTEPPDTSQNAADREEEVKYIKEMCGG